MLVFVSVFSHRLLNVTANFDFEVREDEIVRKEKEEEEIKEEERTNKKRQGIEEFFLKILMNVINVISEDGK